MESWWASIGEASLAVGFSFGLVWATISTAQRRRKFLTAALRPVGQLWWFMLNFVSMGCYFTLIAALGLASHYDMLPPAMFWFLLSLSAAAFATAMMFPGTTQSRPMVHSVEMREPPPVDPPLLPLRKSA